MSKNENNKQIFDEEHYLYHLFIRYHSGVLTKKERALAKNALHDIHYGQWDTSKAMYEAIKLRSKLNTSQ